MANFNPNAEVLSSPAITMLCSIIRDKRTTQCDFVKAADRLVNMIAEEGIARLPCVQPTSIVTPCGEYQGLSSPSGHEICAVDIMRSGCILQEAVRKALPHVKTAKILIQRDENTAQPHLFHSWLPEGITDLHVILCDPMLGTGGSALKAIEVLKKAGVQEGSILFINVVSCPEGLSALRDKAPHVRIITASVDDKLNDAKFAVPGLGDFGDRYYGSAGYKEGLWGTDGK